MPTLVRAGQRHAPAPAHVLTCCSAEPGTFPNDWIADVFPSTDDDLTHMTDDQLNLLGFFYGQEFAGSSTSHRREAFARFIGARELASIKGRR